MEFALVTLGDHLADPHTGTWSTQTEKYQPVVDHAVRGEAAGFTSVMLGEHHFCDYIVSSPPVVLAPFFRTFAERYRKRFAATGHPADTMRIGNVFHAQVAPTSQEARRRWEPYYRNYLGFVDAVWDGETLFDGQVRPRQSFDYDRLLASTAICGSAAEVTERLLEARDLLGLDLIALSMDLGALPHDLLMESIDLVGSSVIPAVSGDHAA